VQVATTIDGAADTMGAIVSLLMKVGDLDVPRSGTPRHKAEPPLIVDANA
jgi:hypothetical protein